MRDTNVPLPGISPSLSVVPDFTSLQKFTMYLISNPKFHIFLSYLRMTPSRFEHLLHLVAPYIQKKPCRSREPISPAERLVMTLRYLATGDSQQSQAFNFRVGRSTACNIIHSTCLGIWEALAGTYLRPPRTAADWKNIATEMFEEWNFPNCVGALDGKHVMIECPARGGSEFYNYKGFHSIVLLAMCDAKYCFTLVDVGSFGKDNDATIFNGSFIGKGFASRDFDIPQPENVDGHELPFVIIADEIFALKDYLMKPYPGNSLTQSRRIYNYRLSRCRRTIENTFGILSARWRIFRRPIKAAPCHVDNIVKACLCLHNYLRLTANARYIPMGFVDSENGSGEIISGDWRKIVANDNNGLAPLQWHANRYGLSAKETRDKFERYFNSEEGSLPWQLSYAKSCGDTFMKALYQVKEH